MMSLLNSLIVVAGMLALDGNPLGSQEVLVVQEHPAKIIGSGITNKMGEYSINPSDFQGAVHVLAKVRQGEIATMIHQKIEKQDASNQVNFSLQKSSLIPVRCSLILPEGCPEEMDVFADLLAINGVPAMLQPFFRHASATVAYSYFYRYTTTKMEFTWWFRPGKVRIGGSLIPESDALSADAPKGFAVTRIEQLPDCKPLDGTWLLGFDLEVTEPTSLELRVEAV